MNLKHFSFLLIFSLSCITQVFSSDLDVFITINRFYQIETKESYVEISYLVPFNAVQYAEVENNLLQAKLKSSFEISNKNEIVNAKKYILQTPKYSSVNNINENLTDLIRIKVNENDTLKLEIFIQDITDSSYFSQTVDLYSPSFEEASLSDIMLISSNEKAIEESVFSKNGMTIIPKFMNYYPTEISEIKFYTEFYKHNKSGNYVASYLLTDEEGLYIDGYAAHKKIVNKNYEAIIGGFDISKLPSGNYYLFMELKDAENKILQRKRTFFQRSNRNKFTVENVNNQRNELEVITNNFAKKYDLKNIDHHLQALSPIATNFEKATIESFNKSEDLTQMQNYFFSFWKQRNAKDPEAAWKAYAVKLQFVEKEYTSMNQRGYETSRGRLYLRHGEPFRMQFYRRKSMGEFWIWNYELLDGQSNVNFVFLNSSNITDDFVLVHTNLRNAVYDKEWAEYLKNEF